MNGKQTAIFGFSLSVVLLTVSYIPAIKWMVERWMEPESYYSHGFLVPVISLFIAWTRRGSLKDAKMDTGINGLVIAGVFLLINIASASLRIYFISGFTLVFVLYGLVLHFFGRVVVKNMLFPIFFLLAMVPLPLVLIGNLTVALKLFVADSSVFVLNLIGFPSVRDGSMIRMPGSFILVAAPCSGLRSLIALLTLGVVFAYAAKISLFRKSLLCLSAIPIALASNLARITVLAIVNDLYGQKVAMGFFHDFSGLMVFVLAFVGLFSVNNLLEDGAGNG
ncbi:MAG: exosortase/archaeosortase family protein [Candidatus Omnitrophica bacterium]|nr:exosortase/archaeosortase family protein [Candidatus Omnitrophota bacterium]